MEGLTEDVDVSVNKAILTTVMVSSQLCVYTLYRSQALCCMLMLSLCCVCLLIIFFRIVIARQFKCKTLETDLSVVNITSETVGAILNYPNSVCKNTGSGPRSIYSNRTVTHTF